MASSETQECSSYRHRPSNGLLTTVAQLPSKYKIRYLAHTTVVESPLDLSVKQQSATASSSIVDNVIVPMTPPPSPPKKRYREEDFKNNNDNDIITSNNKTTKHIKTEIQTDNKNKEITPQKPIKITSVPKTSKMHPNSQKSEKKTKAIRKLKFDEDTASPVSGTIIRPLEEITENYMDQSGDIDPQYNIVEVTEEAKAELAAIKNVIGAYVCKLCRIEFEDAFGLARHRCSCIVLLEYRCPECGKRFNCPANLASHRRWHKPKDEVLKKQNENSENDQQFGCDECGKVFKRQAYLRKHLITHKKEKNSKSNEIVVNGSISSTSTTSSSVSISVTPPSYRTDDSNSMESSSHYSQQTSYHHQLFNEQQQTEQQQQQIQLQNYHQQHTINDHGHYYRYDSDLDYNSDCSSPGRLHIVETSTLTEEENIAAAALAHLRNGPSVIQHTTAAIAF